MIRVFLLDDHEIVRNGVKAALDAQDDMTVVGEAGSAATAMRAVAETHPDVAVIDVRLGDGSGIDICRSISEEYDDIATLILTSYEGDQALIDAGRAGASGFVLKQIRTDELIEAIRQVHAGRQLLDDATIRQATLRLSETDEGRVQSLTPQERRIFDCIGAGMTNRQIASEMFLAEKTVKNYVSNLLAKLGMSRRSEVAALSARLDERHLQDS